MAKKTDIHMTYFHAVIFYNSVKNKI